MQPPPSSFVFPFQSHAGNPDPGTAMPRYAYSTSSRRSSIESVTSRPRPPFASPVASTSPRTSLSRPPSVVWSPQGVFPSQEMIPPQPLPSTKLTAELAPEEKPWLGIPEPRAKLSWWITFSCFLLGIAASAVVCFFGVLDVNSTILPDRLCSKLDESFGGGISEANWNYVVGADSSREHFQIFMKSNAFERGGQLYLLPTLTETTLGGADKVFQDNTSFKIPDCSSPPPGLQCSVSASGLRYQPIPPVMSAGLTTRGKRTIDGRKGGRIDIRMKLGRGDWLSTVVSLDTEDEGERASIEIVNAHMNNPEYPSQGSNFIRSAVVYNPIPFVQSLHTRIQGWWQTKRGGFHEDFHIYTLEYTPKFMRFYVDNRIQSTLFIRTRSYKESFFGRGKYGATTTNGTDEIVVKNPWSSRGNNAPFDGTFHLNIQLIAGGKDGYFPDGVGGKPWVDSNDGAIWDYAKAKDGWYRSWPQDEGTRATRVDSIRMWEVC